MKLSLLYATPAYRGQAHDFLQDQAIELVRACVFSEILEAQWKAKGGNKYTIGQPTAFVLMPRLHAHGYDVATARNFFARTALHLRADWLLMSDADNWCVDGRGILEMLKAGHVKGAAVIAAPVLRRDGTYNAQAVAAGPPIAKLAFAGQIVPVERVGSAFTAINVAWLREHWGAWDPSNPWFKFELHAGDRDALSEDFWFCDEVRKRGGSILLDGRIEAIHDGAPYQWQQGRITSS